MELGFSDEQRLLAEMVQQLCADQFPLERLRAVENSPAGYCPALWRQIGALGLTGLNIAPDAGGLGLGLLETALVYEAFGRHLVPSPHFTSAVLAARLLAASTDSAVVRDWLGRIASGETVVAVAIAGSDDDLVATPVADGYRLDGTLSFVPFAGAADALLARARCTTSGAAMALLLPAGLAGLHTARQQLLGSEPHYRVSCAGVIAEAGHRLSLPDVAGAWRDAQLLGCIPQAAQAVGAARRVHEISVAYAKERHAFGRPIGGFQALAHDLAEAAVAIEGCQTLTLQAAWLHDADRDWQAVAAMAKLQAGAMFRRVSMLAIQVHGGIGYTIEADPQLFFRRAKQWQLLNGSPEVLEDHIARLTLPAASPGATVAGTREFAHV